MNPVQFQGFHAISGHRVETRTFDALRAELLKIEGLDAFRNDSYSALGITTGPGRTRIDDKIFASITALKALGVPILHVFEEGNLGFRRKKYPRNPQTQKLLDSSPLRKAQALLRQIEDIDTSLNVISEA